MSTAIARERGATPAELWSVGQDNIAEWLGGLTIGGACLSC